MTQWLNFCSITHSLYLSTFAFIFFVNALHVLCHVKRLPSATFDWRIQPFLPLFTLRGTTIDRSRAFWFHASFGSENQSLSVRRRAQNRGREWGRVLLPHLLWWKGSWMSLSSDSVVLCYSKGYTTRCGKRFKRETFNGKLLTRIELHSALDETLL